MSDHANDLDIAPPAEGQYRRPDFLGGLPIRLADGQEWAFLGPREIAFAEGHDRDIVAVILEEIAESEGRPDRLQGELTLAIHLLSLNYDLTPAEYTRLLEAPAGAPILVEMQAAFHDLADRHARARAGRSEARPVDQGRRFRFPTFRPHARHPGGTGRGKRAC